MGLDIYFTKRKNIVCPRCGELVTTEDVRIVGSSGRTWYPILESLGYYVPHDQRTEENNWYDKDMCLTTEQTREVYKYVKEHFDDLYCGDEVLGLIATTLVDENVLVINASW